MEAMTCRERILTAFRHAEPDRTPIFEYVLLSPVADRLLGHTYAADPANWNTLQHELGWEEAVRRMAADRLELACRLGHDMMYVTPNPPPPPRPSGDIPPRSHPSQPCPPDDPAERVRQRNVQRAAVDPTPPDASLLVYAFLQEQMHARNIDLPILAPAYAHGVWTDVDLMQTMLLDETVAHDHFALATRTALARVEKYLELGLDLVGVGGDFAGNTPLISPDLYRIFIVPEVCKVSRRIHEGGAWAVNASDGNLWSVLDDFLFGCEVDGYLEIDLHAGMDLQKLKQYCGDRVTFVGNLDCGNTLSFGSPEQVRDHVLDCLAAGMGNGGHILCASNAITASVPYENYLAVINAHRKYFGLPAFTIHRS